MILFGDSMPIQFFDSLFHLFDPRFPLSKNYFYNLESFTVSQYQSFVNNLKNDFEFVGGAITSHRLQRFDQSFLLDALERLGANYVGVTQLPTDYPDSAIESLNRQRVRGLKFEFVANDEKRRTVIEDFIKRVFTLVKWHVHFVMSAEQILEWKPMVGRLCQDMPVSIVLPTEWQSVSSQLVELLQKGLTLIVDNHSLSNPQTISFMKQSLSINSESILMATGLPEFDEKSIACLFSRNALEQILVEFDGNELERIFLDNARKFYNI